MPRKKKLNTRFLIVVSGIFAALAVSVAIAAYVYRENPGRLEARAQAAEERGDWDFAAGQWERLARRSNNDPDLRLRAVDAMLRDTSHEEGPEFLRRAHGAYEQILGAYPDNVAAMRGRMRLLTEDRSFLAGPNATAREARRVAGEILSFDAADAEARAVYAAATLALAPAASEQIDPSAVDEAEQTLKEVALTRPGNGLAVALSVRRLLAASEQARAGNDLTTARSRSEEAVEMLDGVAGAAPQQHVSPPPEKRVWRQLDPAASLHRHLAEGYALAAQVRTTLLLSEGIRNVRNTQPAGGATRVPPELAAEVENDAETRRLGEAATAHLAIARGLLRDAEGEGDVLLEEYLAVRVAYADSLRRAGQVEQAQEELRDVVARRPWDPAAANQLASFLQTQGQAEAALDVLRNAKASDADDRKTPPVPGVAGANLRVHRLALHQATAEALLQHALTLPAGDGRRKLLAEAQAEYEEFDARRTAYGFNVAADARKLEGRLQIARGDVAQGINTLNLVLRATEGRDLSQAERRVRVEALAALVDANRRIGQSGAVRRHLEQLAEANPTNLAVRRELAEVLLAQGDVDRARQIADQLAAAAPDDPSVQQLRLRLTSPDQIEREYARLPESTDSERRVKLNLAVTQGKRDEAIRLATLLHETSPQDATLASVLAQQLAAAGRVDEASDVLEPFVQTNEQVRLLQRHLTQGGEAALEEALASATGVRKLLLEAQVADARGDQTGALAKLEEAVRLEPDNAAAGEQLFSRYATLGRLDDADRVGQSLRRLEADGMDGRSYPIRMQLLRGEAQAAVDPARRLATTYPQMADAVGLYAQALQASGRFNDAADQYRRALDLVPDSQQALAGMLTVLEATGRFADARRYIDTGLRVAPGNEIFRNADRVYQLQFGDPGRVVADRRAAADAAPDRVEPRIELGQTLFAASTGATRRNDASQTRSFLEEAYDVFAQATDDFPKDLRVLNGLLVAAFELGGDAVDRAGQKVDAAVAAGGPLADNLQAVTLAADYWTRRGEPARGETVVRQMMSRGRDLTPEQRAQLRLTLSSLLSVQGDRTGALDVLEGFEAQPAVLRRKIELLSAPLLADAGDDAAYRRLRQVADDLDPRTQSPAVLNTLAVVEINRGDFDRATRLLSASREADPEEGRTRLFEGIVERSRPGGDLAAAEDHFREALRRNPVDVDALRELVNVQRLTGRRDDAEGTLARLLEVNPADVQARLDLVGLMLAGESPRHDEAVRQFRLADDAGVGNDLRLLVSRAQMESARGRVNDALATLDRAASAADDAPEAEPVRQQLLLARLDVLLRAERFDDVIRLTRQAADAPSTPWQIVRTRAEALARAGRRDDAAAAYAAAAERARAVGGEDAVVVDMARRLGLEAATRLLGERIADPASATAQDLYLAGQLYVTNNRPADALPFVRALTSRDLSPEQEASALLLEGTILLQTSPRQAAEAERTLRRLLEIQPRNVAALNNLAYALTLRADDAPEQGLPLLAEAVELSRLAYTQSRQAATQAGQSVNPNVTDTYGWSLSSHARLTNDRGQLREAVALLREARTTAEASGQPFGEVYYHLAVTLAADGDATGSREAADAGLAFLNGRPSGDGDAAADADLERRLRATRDATSAEAAAGV